MKFSLAVIGWLLALQTASASELKQETLSAWDEYVQAANARMAERLHPDNCFLLIDEAPERARQVRSGGIVVWPADKTPQRIASGLVHDWMGAIFVPNARVQDVFSVVRDYDHYKEFYAPGVVTSQGNRHSDGRDQFSMLLTSKSGPARTALDSDYESTYFQVDSRRWYSVSYTTRVQEIEEYGQPGEHRLPLDQGHGYIWRLYSITRFKERDGGVYIEVEGIALSRDIPAAVRWVVDPIVRRFSKSSVTATLKQTQEAVGVAAATARFRPRPQPVSSDPR